MNKRAIGLVLVLTLLGVGCGSNQEAFLTEQEMIENETEQEIVWDEVWYRNLFSQCSDEEIITIVVDDFDGDGKEEAFANSATIEEKETFEQVYSNSDLYESGYLQANFWYMRGEVCQKIEEESVRMYFLLEKGKLGDTKYVCLTKENGAYAPDISVLTSFYIVENGEYKRITECENGVVTTDGYLSCGRVMWTEDGRQYEENLFTLEEGILVPAF